MIRLIILALVFEFTHGDSVVTVQHYNQPAGITYASANIPLGARAGPVSIRYTSGDAANQNLKTKARTQQATPIPEPGTEPLLPPYHIPLQRSNQQARPRVVTQSSYSAPPSGQVNPARNYYNHLATVKNVPKPSRYYATPTQVPIVATQAPLVGTPTPTVAAQAPVVFTNAPQLRSQRIRIIPNRRNQNIQRARIEVPANDCSHDAELLEPQNVETKTYTLRRPAIQKHFYDIEERVIVRPAGSAVIQLEDHNPYYHHPDYETSSINPTYAGQQPVYQFINPPQHPVFTEPPVYHPIYHPVIGHPQQPAYYPAQIPQQPELVPAQYPEYNPPIYPEHNPPQQPEYNPPQQPEYNPPQPSHPQPEYNPPQPSHPQPGTADTDDTVVVESAAKSPAFHPTVITPNNNYIPAKEEQPSSTPCAPEVSDINVVSTTESVSDSSTPFHVDIDKFQDETAEQDNSEVEQFDEVNEYDENYDSDAVVIDARTKPANTKNEPNNVQIVYAENAGNSTTQIVTSNEQSEQLRKEITERGDHDHLLKIQQPDQFYHEPQRPVQNVAIQSNGAAPRLTTINLFRSSNNQQRSQQQQQADNENRQRFLDFFAIKGGVTEIDYNSTPTSANIKLQRNENAGNVRARVVSVTPAPLEHTLKVGERSQIRRIVVSKPIETIEHVKVPAEPEQKFARIQQNRTPQYYRAAHQSRIQVTPQYYSTSTAASPQYYSTSTAASPQYYSSSTSAPATSVTVYHN